MLDFFSRLFCREKSGRVAKERLQLVLIHDRNDISPETLENIKVDMILTLKKYLEIDESGIDMQLDRQNRSVALIANIPLKNLKRHTRGQAVREQEVKAQPATKNRPPVKGQKKKNA